MAGIPYVISIHPAEKARTPHPKATSISASRLLRHATVLVSRFSTLPYEAMARGVPFIYHNPHAEKVHAFQEALGAFPTTADASRLGSCLDELSGPGESVREQCAAFFDRQIDIDSWNRSEQRSAHLIATAVEPPRQ